MLTRKAFVICCVVSMIFAVCASRAFAQPADCPAPMWGLNYANTGQSQHIGFVGQPRIAWRTYIGDNTPFPLNLAMDKAGTIYAASCNGFAAVDSATGNFAYPQTFGWRDTRVALDVNGNMYGWEMGQFTARRTDGTFLWVGVPAGVSDGDPPKIGPCGTIYAPEISGQVFAYFPDGRLKWSSQEYGLLNGERAIVPAIDEVGNLYFGSATGYVSLDPEGNQRWIAPVESADDHSRVIVGPDACVYYSMEGTLYVRNTDNGSLVRDFPISGMLHAMNADGTLYFAEYGGITARASADGQVIWRCEVSVSPYDQIVVDQSGNVFVCEGKTAIALSNQGDLLWEIEIQPGSTPNTTAPIIGPDGAIYIQGRGEIIAIVPEPATLSLLAVGAVALIRRRRK